MPVCDQCGVVVQDLGRHRRRNRCQAQHIRHKDPKNPIPDRGERQFHK